MGVTYNEQNGQWESHFSPRAAHSTSLVHSPMPASHNYVSSSNTERARGYEAWLASRGKEGSASYCNEKLFHGAEATQGYSNMRRTLRQQDDYTVIRTPALGADEYDEKVFAAAKARKGYANMRPAVYARSPVFDDEYSNMMYSGEYDEGYTVIRAAAWQKEDMYPQSPVLYDHHDDEYKYHLHQMNSAEADRGYEEYGNMVFSKPTPMESTNTRKAIALGPWGGHSGDLFDDGVYTGIREIQLTRAGGIVSIRVRYDMEGKAVWGSKNGGSHGMKVDKIVLDYPSEYLTRISGYYGSTILRGPTVIKSLTFHTNKHKYGPFGDEQGISFSSAGSVDGKIVGFSGRVKAWYVGSIGVHVMEGKSSQPAYDALNMNGGAMRISELVWAREPEQWPAEESYMVNGYYNYGQAMF